MATMTHRTSFALDVATTQKIKRLAAHWNVSQAEVVRRSVDRVEKQDLAETPDPVAKLQALFAAGKGLSREIADRWIAEVLQDDIERRLETARQLRASLRQRNVDVSEWIATARDSRR